MTTLHLDLHNLRPTEASSHVFCRYASPCIIGTMVPEDIRDGLDNHDDPGIVSLIYKGLIEFPTKEQEVDAGKLQRLFDCRLTTDPEYLALIEKYVS